LYKRKGEKAETREARDWTGLKTRRRKILEIEGDKGTKQPCCKEWFGGGD
jgi:hypothetical protein